MSDPTTADLIANAPITQELSTDECAVFSGIVERQTLADNERLLSEGTQDDSLHIIVSGRLAVEKDGGVGEAMVLTVLKAGDLAGELGFIDGTGHSATLRALGETQVVTLHRERFESLLQTHPQIVYKIMRAVVRNVHNVVRRMNAQYVEMSNYITKAHGRY
ncbi:MAG: cyclic nucleotide-binding domain-containing protein [Chromatiales bacterium]|nr:cyclic nucleotide-binding domain-containing protein [Chromatiales bacterium]